MLVSRWLFRVPVFSSLGGCLLDLIALRLVSHLGRRRGLHGVHLQRRQASETTKPATEHTTLDT